MHIGLDLAQGEPGTGVRRYSESLARALFSLAQNDNEYFTFLTSPPIPLWLSEMVRSQGENASTPTARIRTYHGQRKAGILQILWNNLVLGPALGRLGIDVYHGVDGHLMAYLGSRKVARVVTVHDLNPLHVPELMNLRSRLFTKHVLPHLVRRADRVIVVSQSTGRDLIELVPDIADRVRVIYHGVDPSFSPATPEAVEACRHRLGLPIQYILYVGQITPAKNLSRLLAAYSILHKCHADIPPLVLSGRASWMADKIMRQVSQLHLGQLVLFTGIVPERELAALLTGAQIFVFPSAYEGFGFPLLEAMACGTPVVTSNLSSLPEVTGEAAVLVDPASSEAIADGILCLLDNASLRRRLAEQALLRAHTFRWVDTARQTLQVYREAVLCRAS